MKNKLDLRITPLRLAVVVVGLGLVGLNEYFGWNIPYLSLVFTVVLLLSIVLTQPKGK